MAVINDADFRFIPYDSLAFDDDTITGRDLSGLIDFIDGGGGDDNIDGRDGSDVLIGGAGEDVVFGGDGGNMDFLIGGILDFVEEVDAETLAGVSNFLQDAESSGFLEAVVDVLDGAENLQDVVAGITQAVSNESSEFQQALAGIMEAFPQILTWQQDEDVDVFKAADSFEENGVDIIFGYDHEHDIIDFGTIIELEGAAAAKENAVNDFIEYNETTGALTDGDDNNWFFVYSGFNPFAPAPAETVRIEVDGDVFVWDTGSNEFDMLV